jgi:DNA-binding response OmpR family regulator
MADQQNIIIVEDSETFSLLVTHYLKNNLGHVKVYVENSGAKAIERMKDLKPSLVVLDYYLEDDLSAIDVMIEVNKMEARPKVILLSSIKDEVEKAKVMSMGIERFVQKSNESMYELLQCIEELLEDRRGVQHTNPSKLPGLFWLAALTAVIALSLAFYFFFD